MVTQASLPQMERYRVIGSVDNFDGQQDLDEWVQMMDRAAEFAGWGPEHSFKAALFRLRGEAGEFAEQLRDEGKISSWTELKDALKERYNTAGKEQWHQYLLNTATQGRKTVHEWAQTVRKLSLLALGKESMDPRRTAEAEEAGEGGGAGTPQHEPRKQLLDYMRKSNFVRGLRSSLRQMVWREKCLTFDEAVQVAAEEETVEASHREGEVLGCYRRDPSDLTGSALIEQIVAVLEVREEAKRKKEAKQRDEARPSTVADPPRYVREAPLPVTPGAFPAHFQPPSGQQYIAYQPPPSHHYQYRPARTEGYPQPPPQRYGEQRPFRRNMPAGPAAGEQQDWARREWRAAVPPARNIFRRRAVPTCFNCDQPDHFRSHCPYPSYHQPGNGAQSAQRPSDAPCQVGESTTTAKRPDRESTYAGLLGEEAL